MANVWITCKERVVHGELQIGKLFFIRGKRSLLSVPMLLHLQMKRCGRKYHQVFLTHLSEVEIQTKYNKFGTKRVKVYLDDFKDIFFKELKELLPITEMDHAIYRFSRQCHSFN